MKIDFEDLPLDHGIRLVAGVTLYQPVTLRHNGAAVDLTDHTVAFGIADDSGAPIVETTEITPYNAAEGKFILRAEATDTASWPPGEYVYEVHVTFPPGATQFAGGAVVPVLKGTITVVASII